MFNAHDTLDSRALRATDCYGQRFMRSGSYHYHVLPSGGGVVDTERPFTVLVQERKSDGRMSQHNVALRWDGRHWHPDRQDLVIEAGDLVVWNCPDQKAPPYEVAGDKAFFNSGALLNECGYSHAFGMPGTYAWGDALGSGLGGVVRVKTVDCRSHADLAHWRAALAKAALVMVQGGKAEPAEVEVLVGQTVYFAVVAGNGITITDKRLIGMTGVDDCQPRKAA
jgi:plastocyanin